MGNQRLIQTQTAATDQKQHLDKRTKQSEYPMQEALGSRAASRHFRAQLQRHQAEGASSPNLLHSILPSISPVSPRAIQAKPKFRGLSHELTPALDSRGMVIQAKMTIGAPGDKYEQEADRVAEQVVDQMHSQTISGTLDQSKGAIARNVALQRQPARVQALSNVGGISAPSSLETAICREQGSGHPLPEAVREPMEEKLGADFSSVRIHADTQSDALNRSISATAFTAKQDIFFKQGQYNPNSVTGQQLIAHELTHVLQQGKVQGSDGGVASIQRNGDDPPGWAKEGVTKEKVVRMEMLWYSAALKVIKMYDKNAMGKRQVFAVDGLQKKLEKELKRRERSLNGGPDIDDLVLETDELEAIYPVHRPKELYTAISTATGESGKIVKEDLRNAYIRELNSQEWRVISKEINFGDDTNPNYYTSEITPVNEGYHEHYGPGGKDYGYTGLNSMSSADRLTKDRNRDKEDRRTTNLAYTEFREGKQDQGGEIIFAAFRSGALSGKKISDAGEHQEATRYNTRELLEAMLIKHLQEAPIQRRVAMLTGVEVAEITVVSTSLQSRGLMGAEGDQVSQQLIMLKEFEGRDFEFEILRALGESGRKKRVESNIVKARFKVIAMNYGVNAQGDFWKRNNSAEIKRLIKEAQEKHKSVRDEAQRRKIDHLIAKVKKGEKEGSSYKMAARVANLAFLIGCKVHFNCKSGKDRTGLMDVESKYLALKLKEEAKELEQNNQLNPTNVERSSALKYAHATPPETHEKLLFQSGNLEMQQYNTGGQGYKIAPAADNKGLLGAGLTLTFTLPPLAIVPLHTLKLDNDLKNRVGGAYRLKQLQGLQRYTNIDKI